MIIPVENDDQPLNKNIESHPEKNLISIDEKHPVYDPLLYVLIFLLVIRDGS